MILHALNELYDRLSDDPEYAVAPPGYSLQKITFKVVLTEDGELVSIEDVRDSSDGRSRARQLLVPGSTKPPGPGINPGFLWDNTGYMLGYEADDHNPERTRKTFEAFRARHLGCEEAIGSAPFSAVCRFLEEWHPEEGTEHEVLEDAATTGYGIFQLQGQTRFVHEDPEVREWWEDRSGEEEEEIVGQCLVTGEPALLARLHEKVKGVRGTTSSGAPLVGFNKPAYESYGKEQSYNAPVSQEVEFRYVTALNALLDGPMRDKHRLAMGDTTVVFWTESSTPTEDIFVEFAAKGSAIADEDVQDEGRRQRIERFLRAVREGGEAHRDLEKDPKGTPYFLLGLSPNAGRVSVRFFERASLADLLENLSRHHRDIGLSRPPSGRDSRHPEFPPMWMLLAQTARERKEIPPILEGPLLRAIVTRRHYPDSMYTAVMRRLHADRTVDYLRCCVIKGYLNRNLNQEVSMSLDTERNDPAYRLGRLFAALEKTQKDALGGNLNKTIRDGYYSSASATPGSVFPRLLRTYQHHLGQLEGGHRVNRERLVQGILDPLDTFPPQLSLADQGLFAIGYYHQTSDFYTKRSDSSSD